MNKKARIFGFSIGLIVLVALLLQSFHAGHHLEELFAEKQCHHKYDKYKTEISHAHHDFDDCFVCEFTFSGVFSTSFFSFKLEKVEPKSIALFSDYVGNIQFFSGSLFSLRGPPIV
jgi:hypothetical protein